MSDLSNPPSAEAQTTTPNANGNAFVDSVKSNTASTMDTIINHPITQNAKDTLTNGPVADSVRNQTTKAGSDISGLAQTRTTPNQPAATGQPLTYYHSFFYNLLSWEHPRATAISFAVALFTIFASRYLPLVRWFFKATYLILGATATAEVAGKYIAGTGLASNFRPRRYYTIPRETLDATLDDVEQLINFVVIESQRILFAESVPKTVATFVAAFFGYWLVKWLPLWGLGLLSTVVAYLAPLVYIQNKEIIDEHLNKATNVVNNQAAQVRSLAGQHTSRATSTMKQYAGDYGAKAQEYIGTARQKMPSPTLNKAQPAKSVDASAFPTAPTQDPAGTTKTEPEAVPAS
ncbi:MAG: hypothetical protein Q9160_002206 [Pyrenula sp. 1 TL-2023]